MAAAPVIIPVQCRPSTLGCVCCLSCAAAALALPGRGRRGRLKLELIAHVIAWRSCPARHMPGTGGAHARAALLPTPAAIAA